MIRYSFVVPIYKDASLAEAFCNAFLATFKEHTQLESIEQKAELIFVNDGSGVEQTSILNVLVKKYPFVKVIELSRNFGQHIALSCGYRYASGSFVGMMNVDMEDPPNQIPVLLKPLEAGECDIALGMRINRTHGFFNNITSLFFHNFFNAITGYKIPYLASTVRIMNRQFIDAYNSFTEKSRYIPGLEQWLGFRHLYCPIETQPRKVGNSSYNFKRRLKMALDSIITFSDIPLRFAAVLGFGLSFLGFVSILLIVYSKLFLINYLPGFSTSISLILLIGGIQIFFIGMASLYIGRILKEVQNRPLFVIRQMLNFDVNT